MNLRFLAFVVGLVAELVSHPASAQVVAPSAGGSVNAVRVTATTMELSFGTDGSGQGRVVAIAAAPGGMIVPLAIADDKFYTAAPVFGQGAPLGKGYVIYNGPGHSVTVTGLEPNTYYYVASAEYNANGTHIAYNTRGSSMTTATRAAPASPLPVELLTFSGTIDSRSMALLHWTTASERNAVYFALERSINGNDFMEANRVLAAGTSSQQIDYQWLDPLPLTGSTCYRLRQVDHDSAVNYSSVVTLAPSSRVARQVEVYPNPSAGRPVQLLLQGFAGESLSVRLSDALGRSVMAQAQTLVPATAYQLSALLLLQGLPAGTYFLSLAGSGLTIQKRIIISD